MSVQPALIITFDSSAGAVSENYWIRVFLDGEGRDDTATIADGAAAVDAVFDIDPCEGHLSGKEVEYDADGNYSDAVPEDGFWPLIAETIEIVTCTVTEDYSWDAVVNVVRSHNAEVYQLVIDVGVGTIKEIKTIQELVTDSIVFDNELVKDLEFPVVGALAMGWAGVVNTSSGKPPIVTLKGTTINLNEPATGTLSVQYQTSYDQVTINIPGDVAKKELLPAEILVFYHFLVEPLTLTPPDIDETTANDAVVCTHDDKYVVPEDTKKECWETIRKVVQCACDYDQEYSSEVVDQAVDCPEGMEAGFYYEGTRTVITDYADCAASTADPVNATAFYLQHCCHPPAVTLPKCNVKTSLMKGGISIVNGADFYKGLYGPATKIVGVTPKDGICGTIEVKQQVISQNCCDGIAPVRFVDPTDVTNATGTHQLFIGEGMPPFTLTTHNVNSWFEGGTMILVTNNRTVNLLTRNACGMVMVEVSDLCGRSDSLALRSTLGQWAYAGAGCPSIDFSSLPDSEVEFAGNGWFHATKGAYRVSEQQSISDLYAGGYGCGDVSAGALALAAAAYPDLCLPVGTRELDRYAGWDARMQCGSPNGFLVGYSGNPYYSYFLFMGKIDRAIYHWEC